MERDVSVADFSDAVVSDLWRRAYSACERCGRGLTRSRRGWQWSAHHRSPRGMGGSADATLGLASNGLILCGHGTDGCHGWVESNRSAAVLAGLIVPEGEVSAEVPVVTYTFGLVRLTDSGGVVRA